MLVIACVSDLLIYIISNLKLDLRVNIIKRPSPLSFDKVKVPLTLTLVNVKVVIRPSPLSFDKVKVPLTLTFVNVKAAI